MAWGSFVKKLKGFGNKLVSGAREAVTFAKEKVLPGAKKIAEIIAPFTPYGGTIQKGLEFADNLVNKADEYVEMGENVQSIMRGNSNIPLKQFVGQKVRI